MAGSYDEENSNYGNTGLTHVMTASGGWMEIMKITTKDLQFMSPVSPVFHTKTTVSIGLKTLS